MFSKVLLPTDGSPNSEKAIKKAMVLAQKLGSEVMIFHVVPRPTEAYTAPGMGGFADDLEVIISNLEKSGMELIKKIENDYSSYGVKFKTKYIIGDPSEEIIKEAKDGYDSIVMANRGLGGIKGFFMGSVSSKVVKNAQCSVTIVR